MSLPVSTASADLPTTAAEDTGADELPPEDILGGRRLLLVSNREPYVRRRQGGKVRFERTTGGLVTALDPVMRRCRGVWIAWQPDSDTKKEQEDERYLVPATGPRFTLRRVPLSTGEVRRYYYGFANRALWPLFHYFVDRCHFAEDDWEQYVQVNRRFADAIVEEARPDDFIWIHDYHFCLLPAMLRERMPDHRGPIAFFLHIPFPTEETFRVLPWSHDILEGLLGADLVGFHVKKYAGDFLGCCQRRLGAEVDHERGLVSWGGRRVGAGAYPIGIDVAAFQELAGSQEVAERVSQLRRSIGGEKVVLGVDRLDYSKGIPERIYAIDHLLRHYPEHRGTVTFVQVAVPSRTQVKEYKELKRQIDELVGRINGRWGNAEWQPIRYLYRSLPRPELVAYYRAADVVLVTPLRDGMNLVAKEYCASRIDVDGVLVLSEFTGAADVLGRDSLVVNPFAVADVARELNRALTMDREDRHRRMAALRERVAKTDVNRWLASILRDSTRRFEARVGEEAR